MSSRGPLSPEPSEEGFGSYGGGGGGCTLGGKPPNSLKLSSSEMPPQVHFITANVGSIFEEPTLLIPQWLDQVMGEIQRQNPKFVAIHCQEVGGKNFQKSMEHVNKFVGQVVSCGEKLGFNRVAAFFDENFQASDKFTALGSIYLIHETLPNVEIYNFETRTFSTLTKHLIHLGCIDGVAILDKQKFPLQYFPDSRWSRKGYLRTRWRVGIEPMSSAFDLINIHLFHDACNLKSVESEGPSIYVNFRQRALEYALDNIAGSNTIHPVLPFFIFGDFNFRLNGRSVVDALDVELRVKADEDEDTDDHNDDENCGHKNGERLSRLIQSGNAKVRENSGEKRIILLIGKKEFDLGGLEHDNTFREGWRRWTEYDLETRPVRDRLTEFPLNFPPTYPFEETLSEGTSYMKTRCPAWCDRVLLSHDAAEKLIHRPQQQQQQHRVNGLVTSPSDVSYDVIGGDVCMGDHKPVFLSFKLGLGNNNSTSTDLLSNNKNFAKVSNNEVESTRDVIEREMPPSIESPSYTDLLDNNLYSKYIELRDNTASSLKMFKETTV